MSMRRLVSPKTNELEEMALQLDPPTEDQVDLKLLTPPTEGQQYKASGTSAIEFYNRLHPHSAHPSSTGSRTANTTYRKDLADLSPSEPNNHSSTMSKREEAQQALYETGMPIRRAVLSDAYVDRALANGSSEFAKSMQEFTTAFCWGAVWGRPGLERK